MNWWLHIERFISRPSKWLDGERYLHRQGPYGMHYCLHKILSVGNVIELNAGLQTNTTSLRSIMKWWLRIQIYITLPKVV